MRGNQVGCAWVACLDFACPWGAIIPGGGGDQLRAFLAEDIVRGRLNSIRQAEAGKARISIEQANRLFEQTLDDVRELRVLSLTPAFEEKRCRRQGCGLRTDPYRYRLENEDDKYLDRGELPPLRDLW